MNKFTLTLTNKDKVDLDVTNSTTPEFVWVCAQAAKQFALEQTNGIEVDPELLNQTLIDIFKKALYK